MSYFRRAALCSLALLSSACGSGLTTPDGALDVIDAVAARDGIDPARDATGFDGIATDVNSTDVTPAPDATRLDVAPAPDASDALTPPTDAMIDPGPGPTRQCTFTPDAQGFFTLTSPRSDYWVRLPPGYDVRNPRPLPLLVALHGCGDTAHNHATWAAVPYALRASQNYIGISVGGRDGTCWTVSTDDALVMAAIADVRSCFWVHQKHIFISGYSSGGMLAYSVGMRNAAMFAAILIENSGLSQAVGNNNVGAVLAAAAWRIHVAHVAHIMDGSFAIAGVRSDRDRIMAAGFDMRYWEFPGDHNGTSDDWAMYLIPQMAGWSAP